MKNPCCMCLYTIFSCDISMIHSALMSHFYSQSDISMIHSALMSQLSWATVTLSSDVTTRPLCPYMVMYYLAIRLCCLTSYMATNEACPAQIWAYYILMTSSISIYGHEDMGTNGACPNMGHIWPQMRHAQLRAYCILMTSAICIYGQKKDNEICPNMES